jgi:hypothetical protein
MGGELVELFLLAALQVDQVHRGPMVRLRPPLQSWSYRLQPGLSVSFSSLDAG